MPGTVIKSKKIIAALLTLALSAFLPPVQALAAAKDYKDAEHGFSFSYPETWRYSHLENYLELTSPYAGDFRAVVIVQVSPPLEAMMTGEALASFHKMLMEDVQVSSFRKIELDGVHCAVFDTTDKKTVSA